MKNIILIVCFLVFSMMNGQTIWRSVGPDDYNQASYGTTNGSSDAIKNSRLATKNGNVYLMNLELGATSKVWFVMSKFSNGKWQHIDTPFLFTPSTQVEFSFEVDNNEVPYLFLGDPLNGDKASVKKYNGTDWVDLGGAPVSTVAATPLTMTVGSDNLPFVIYREGNVVKANKFNGSTWDAIPTSDLDGLYTAVVKTDHNNVPYVLYNGFLKKFNGTGWDEVGITGFSSTGLSMCFDTQNHPYVVVGNSIRKFDGVSWQTLPSLPSVYSSVTLAIDADDNLFAAYTNTFLLDRNIQKFVGGLWQSWGSFSSYGPLAISIDGNTVYEQHTKNTNFPAVQKRTGSIWEMLGVESELRSATNQIINFNDLAIYNGLPVVCYKNYKLAVKESDANGVWGNVGATAISEESIYNTKLETDSDGNLFVAYLNIIPNTNTSRVTVKKRVGSNWELVGPLNFSLDCTSKLDFKINHQNVPYVVYKSGRVQKFNGTSWEFVGGSAYAYDRDLQMTFDNNDQPYIIYQGDSGPIIKKFNGASWEEVGTQSLSAFTNIREPRIIVDASNNIVIAFVDAAQKIFVMKWNGTAWVQLGSEIETNAGIGNNFLSLAIDHNDVLHIMFNRMYNGYRKMANVYKFNGTGWDSLGSPDFSSGDVNEGKIEFTNSNVPVVSYSSLNGIYVKYYGNENALLSTKQQQIAAVNAIVISPNPVTSFFSVKADDKIETIDIFDLTGKKVFSSSETEELNISSLKSGLYLIKMKTSTGIYSEKIFKN